MVSLVVVLQGGQSKALLTVLAGAAAELEPLRARLSAGLAPTTGGAGFFVWSDLSFVSAGGGADGLRIPVWTAGFVSLGTGLYALVSASRARRNGS
jgi:hypothetical protein